MIDYENPDPETLKKWEKEYRNKCRREMSQYLKLFPDATPEEKSALRSWVRSGHSPYENGDFIATDSGGPMDFINARRFQEELYQEYLKNPDAFCDESNSGEWGLFDTNLNSNIPF